MACKSSNRTKQVLTYDQVERLDHVLIEPIQVHGRGNFPTLEIQLLDLVDIVQEKLESEGVKVDSIRLNGGAASFVLSSDPNRTPFNDLDLIFRVDLSAPRNLNIIREVVLESLLNFLPEGVRKERMSHCVLQEAYVDKMFKVTDKDRWSLISLSNNMGKNVELKFVDEMRRQFEFSVDSFQIILDSLLNFYKVTDIYMNEHFYPTVYGESLYGDFTEALSHLNQRLIATRCPEEIRGGGLLKYCKLLALNYEPASMKQIKIFERYMCSRFFIDFKDLNQQQQKLETYLQMHFQGDNVTKHKYLLILRRVVDSSTVCLMGHERRQILHLISEMAAEIDRLIAYEQHQQSLVAFHPYIPTYTYEKGCVYSAKSYIPPQHYFPYKLHGNKQVNTGSK
ncbi:terminal nucleotidyltransferase 5C-like [Anneissia japonica]|uniref:terminal nucleotidyltransferase 5C-like n=1 Tax=Anneissia japonica TaxID=1529436 RepID=UPI001425B98D|nr:terminal nucleotidyltransferase 5C-like [Anneissia japonica]